MRKAIALLFVFAVTPGLLAQDNSVTKALQNLTLIHQLGTIIEMSGANSVVLPSYSDAWGHSFRVDKTDAGYRIVSAGSDGAFDEASGNAPGQFRDFTGDLVMENGKLVRSNRNWLATQVTSTSRPYLQELRNAELQFMMMRVPLLRDMTARKATQQIMQQTGERITTGKEVPETVRDAWGTPLRIERTGDKYRIVSAGADRNFEPSSWGREPVQNFNEDIVFNNGAFTREFEVMAVFRANRPRLEALAQPVDAPLEGARAGEGGVTMPVLTTRAEPRYPAAYRHAGISGVVVVQAAIDATGGVTDVRLLKSLVPEFDEAALDAVRQWKFAPATREGKAVPVLFNVTVTFQP
ncbi:MAG: energy transducer TonB [Acidobacteriota bacterium]|nr:energy transducer TonB [Acidobacteriota bacterium]